MNKFIISGKSMYPRLKDGQYVTLTEIQNPQVGDIIVFAAQNKKIIHRVVAIRNRRLICKGDNCLHFDWTPIYSDNHYWGIHHPLSKYYAKLSLFWGQKFLKKYISKKRKHNKASIISILYVLGQKCCMYTLLLCECIFTYIDEITP